MKDATEQCGVINLFKPAGMTSFSACNRVKKLLLAKKVGHGGTLDPQATGVLPIFVGSATGAFGYMDDHHKKYRADLILGLQTDTDDIYGRVIHQGNALTTIEKIKKTALLYKGRIEQRPPMVSAVRVNGMRLYEYARSKRRDVQIPIRTVNIYELDIDSKPPIIETIQTEQGFFEIGRIGLTVRCSKGTYIRSLCRDMAESMGMYGCMGNLVREQSGPYAMEDALHFEQLEFNASRHMMRYRPVAEIFCEYPAVVLEPCQIVDYLNGIRVRIDKGAALRGCIGGAKASVVTVYLRNHGFLGIGNITKMENGFAVKGKKMFCNPDR